MSDGIISHCQTASTFYLIAQAWCWKWCSPAHLRWTYVEYGVQTPVLCRRDEEDERGVSPSAELGVGFDAEGYFVEDAPADVRISELGDLDHTKYFATSG